MMIKRGMFLILLILLSPILYSFSFFSDDVLSNKELNVLISEKIIHQDFPYCEPPFYQKIAKNENITLASNLYENIKLTDNYNKIWVFPKPLYGLFLSIDKKGFYYFDIYQKNSILNQTNLVYLNSEDAITECEDYLKSWYNNLKYYVESINKVSDPELKYFLSFFRDALGSDHSILYYGYVYFDENNENIKNLIKDRVYFTVKYTCRYEIETKHGTKSYTVSYVTLLHKGQKISCGEDGELEETEFNVPSCNGLDNFEDCYEKLENKFSDYISSLNEKLSKFIESNKKNIGMCYRILSNSLLSDFYLLDYLGIQYFSVPLDDKDKETLFSTILPKVLVFNGKDQYYEVSKRLSNSNVEFWLKKFLTPEGKVDLGGIYMFYREQLKNISYVKPLYLEPFSILEEGDLFIGTSKYQDSPYLKSLENYGLLNLIPYHNKKELSLLDTQNFETYASPKLLTDFVVLFTNGNSYDVLNKEVVPSSEDVDNFLVYDAVVSQIAKEKNCAVGTIYNSIELIKKIPDIMILLKIKDIQKEINEIYDILNNYQENKNRIDKTYNILKTFCENTQIKNQILIIDGVRESVYQTSNIQLESSSLPSLLDYCQLVYSTPSPQEAYDSIKGQLDDLFNELPLLIWKPDFFQEVDNRIKKIKTSPSYVILSKNNIEDSLYELVKSYYQDLLMYFKKNPKVFEKIKKDLEEKGYAIYFENLDNLIPSKNNFNVVKHIEIMYFIISDTKQLLDNAISVSINTLQKYLSLVKNYEDYYNKDKKTLNLPDFNFNYNYYYDKLKCYEGKTKCNICVNEEGYYLQECLLKNIQQDISSILDFLKEKDYTVNAHWAKIYSSMDNNLFEGLRDGDLKCDEAKEILNKLKKYYGYYLNPPFQTKYNIVLETPSSSPLGHYQEIINLLNSLNNLKCEITLGYSCIVDIPTQEIKDGEATFNVKIIFDDVKENYLKYKYEINPSLAKLLNLKTEYVFDNNNLVHYITKEVTAKIFDIQKNDNTLTLTLTPYIEDLRKYCKINYNYLIFPISNIRVVSSDDYQVENNKIILPTLKNYVISLVPKSLENVSQKIIQHKCIYYTNTQLSNNKIILTVNILNNPCYLDVLNLSFNFKGEVLGVYDSTKKQVKYTKDPFTIIVDKKIQTSKLSYIIEFKSSDDLFNFTKKIEKNKEEKKKEIKDFISKDKEGREDLNKISNCDNKDKMTYYLGIYYSLKNEIKNLDLRYLLNKVITLSDNNEIKKEAKNLIEDYNNLLFYFSQLDKQRVSLLDVCGSFDNTLLQKVSGKVEDYKKELNKFMEDIQQDYFNKESILEKLVEKAKKYYQLSLRLYKITKDPYYLDYSKKIEKYANLKIPSYKKLTLKEYIDFLNFYNKLNPFIFEELERKSIRDGILTIKENIKDPKLKNEILSKINKIKDPIKKIDAIFFKPDKELKETPYNFAKKEKEKNVATTLNKTLLKFKLNRLKSLVQNLKTTPEKKKELFEKIREIESELQKTTPKKQEVLVKEINTIQEEVEKLRKESLNKKENENSRTMLYAGLAIGGVALTSLTGGLLWYFLIYKKRKNKKDEDVEDEDFDLEEDLFTS